MILVAGPCVIESRDMILRHAEVLARLSQDGYPLVFKSSYDKANRTSIHSFRGVGLERGLGILAEVKAQFDLPVLTDVHSPAEARLAAEVVDVLQIPAFLGRQTDLLTAAAQTGKTINIKKPPFLSGTQMAAVVEKLHVAGNRDLWLTERGTCFGHHDLVVDFRAVVEMQALGYPVLYDATHSVQQPGGHGTHSGGQRQYVEPLVRAARGLGVSGFFFEVHEDPDRALSDAATQVHLSTFPDLLKRVFDAECQ